MVIDYTYKQFWGNGYVTEAVREIMRFAFEENDVCRISTGCISGNTGSERVMQKCGMTKEGEFKKAQWHDGSLKDRVAYRMLRDEWRAGGEEGKRKMTGFFAGVYETVARIPAGRVATYGQIAMLLGSPGAARTVGWALRAAPDGLPCHRVVRADGGLPPQDIFGGAQRELLEREGVVFTDGGRVELARCLWDMR